MADRGWVRINAWPRLLLIRRVLPPTMTTLELNDHDKAALAAVVRATIAADPFPCRCTFASYARSWRSWSRRLHDRNPSRHQGRFGEPSHVLRTTGRRR